MRLRPYFYESWDAADAAFEQFLMTVPERREQLRDLMARTGGPELDGSAQSLNDLSDWSIEFAFSDRDDGMDWRPLWRYWPTPEELALKHNPPLPDRLYRLWELTGVYLADMYLAHDPTLQWVCWRGNGRIDIKNARFLLDQGLQYEPLNPLQLGNIGIVRAYRPTEQDPNPRPPDRNRLYNWYTRWVNQRHELHETKPRSWQAAPTGRKANKRIGHHPGDFGQNHLP